mmetsp:Transcript_20724/g.33375  ORF Transcript_20724/g.33375 Transcript_20724/m.33375 type:complete len:156 (-) Transcript_20724:33-500(-)
MLKPTLLRPSHLWHSTDHIIQNLAAKTSHLISNQRIAFEKYLTGIRVDTVSKPGRRQQNPSTCRVRNTSTEKGEENVVSDQLNDLSKEEKKTSQQESVESSVYGRHSIAYAKGMSPLLFLLTVLVTVEGISTSAMIMSCPLETSSSCKTISDDFL